MGSKEGTAPRTKTGRKRLYTAYAAKRSTSLILVSASLAYLILKTTRAPISIPIIARKRKDAVMLLTNTMKSKNAAPTTVKAEPASEAKGRPVK